MKMHCLMKPLQPLRRRVVGGSFRYSMEFGAILRNGCSYKGIYKIWLTVHVHPGLVLSNLVSLRPKNSTIAFLFHLNLALKKNFYY